MWVLFRGQWCFVSLLEESKLSLIRALNLSKIRNFLRYTSLYTLIFIGYLLAGVTFVMVVCGNSNKKDK